MIVLGVAFLSDASACVIKNGELLSAISEERINRKKLWHGMPYQAIKAALELAEVSIEDVDVIATHGLNNSKSSKSDFEDLIDRIYNSSLEKKIKERQIDSIKQRYKHEEMVLNERTPEFLKKLDVYGKDVFTYSHHHAHAASAYFGSGWDSCYVITADGWGEDASSTVWSAENGGMKKIGSSNTFDSLGYFYGSITKSIGFTPHRHEGKVLGLAAYSDCNSKIYKDIKDMIKYDSKILGFRGMMEKGIYKPNYSNPELDDAINGYSREEVAAAAQCRLEEVVCQLVSDLSGKGVKICLAGGIFANVKLNQRILAMENVSDIFVFPNMGDGGLSVGAAYLAYHQSTGMMPKPFTTALLGNEISKEEILSCLKSEKIEYELKDDIGINVAELLASGEVVVRVNGRMEFGPRALGNRSILYKCDDSGVNNWLNEKLKRSEFMPFAPITLADYSKEFYVGITGNNKATHYMTITSDCTEKMCQESPAAVHIDKTARPQIINRKNYPDLYNILTEYRRITGKSSVINTSFNMHEEPIVCSAFDAVRAFKESELPWMALGDFLIKGKNA
jgi:carbamoyltransferase